MRILALLVVLAVSAPASHALTLEQVLEKHIAARGGLERLEALKSLRLTGKVAYGNADSTLELHWVNVARRPGSTRTEVSMQGLTAVRAYDGQQGFRISPFGGRIDPERLSADDTKPLARSADLDGPLIHSRDKQLALSYLGVEDVDGTLAHKIEVRRPGGDLEIVFLDPDHFLIIRTELRERVRGVESIEERDFGSYEQVAGVWIPFSIEAGLKDRPRGTRITVERAEANVELNDALFRFPAPGDKPLSAAGADRKAGGDRAATATPPSARSGPARADSGVISGLGARNIGSAAMSGRVAAIAAYERDGKTTVFVGAASGGVWKSIDGATTFRPVFDKQPVQSIGAVTIDPSNPQIVWVGTGESWTRNSVSYGDGIYKSTDGGETWAHVGLRGSERIARILVHPRRSEVVYACVPGRLWSDSDERGVYRTSDGGKSWTLVLRSKSLSTGCSTLAMDPSNPERLIAGLWDFRRKGWTFRSAGDGPDAPSASALHQTSDGGQSWTELAAGEQGLPPKPWGRSAVVFAPSDAKIVYTFIESKDSGLYRSGDGGRTWEARDKSQMMVWRPFYFANLIVDPKNPDRLFKPDLELIVSEDGGKSFSVTNGGAHGDWHDLWIDPANPKHIIGGDDGGLWLSRDGGNRWWKTDNLPISQFYHVAVDNKDPYQVYGGLQDNSSWAGDSAYPGGITSSRWESIADSDGFWTFPDPIDPETAYAESQGGFIRRIDRRTHASRDIQPKAGYREKLRFNWNAPIHLSPGEKGTIYIGAQFLFRSRDRGDSWDRISPDLTTNDPEKQKQEESGGVTVDNSSAEMHTTLYSISESPKNGQVIWAGTDDGNLQLTRDGGKSWQNVVGNLPDLPQHSWVSSVEASRFQEGTAYATFDRHTFGDFDAHVFRTRDFGQTWARIGGPKQGLRGHAHVIKEDAVKQQILFVGTELGLWISIDDGATWAEFKGAGFPSVAVRDLALQPRDGDLVLATHGRGIWIVDDLSPLRALSEEVLAREVAFLPGRPVQQRMAGTGGWAEGDARFVGANPPPGALIAYHLRERHLYGPLKLELLDGAGNVLDAVTPSKRRGINRVSWSMRHKPPNVPRAAQVAESSTLGPRVLPGRYRVRLTKGAQVIDTSIEIGLDRRAPYTLAERKAQLDAALRVRTLFGSMTSLVERLQAARAGAASSAARLPEGDALRGRLQTFATQVEELRKQIVATKEGGAITGEERIREHADQLYGALLGWEGRPAKYQLERIEVLERELGDVKKGLQALLDKELPALDRELQQRQLPPIPTEAHAAAEPDLSSGDVQRGMTAFLRGR